MTTWWLLFSPSITVWQEIQTSCVRLVCLLSKSTSFQSRSFIEASGEHSVDKQTTAVPHDKTSPCAVCYQSADNINQEPVTENNRPKHTHRSTSPSTRQHTPQNVIKHRHWMQSLHIAPSSPYRSAASLLLWCFGSDQEHTSALGAIYSLWVPSTVSERPLQSRGVLYSTTDSRCLADVSRPACCCCRPPPLPPGVAGR